MQALTLGLSIRRVLDQELTHEHALSLLQVVAGALGREGTRQPP